MKRLAILIVCAVTALAVRAASGDSVKIRQIRDEIMLRGTCYDNLRILTKTVGHRLSGSPQSYQAIEWGKKALKEAGADSVWLQPVWVPHWVRGEESLKIRTGTNKSFEPIKMLSLGNAVGTDGKTIQAPVIMVQTIDEFEALKPEAVAGKIVFFNYRFRQDLLSTFQGYGDAVKYRRMPPSLVARKGGLAVIIRSVSTGLDDAPHTGMTWYPDSVKKIPAVAIGNTTADALERRFHTGSVTAQLTTNCKMIDSVLSYNVIGELRGATIPNEYLVCGGHLDSWDVGEGAHDDGAGCVQAIEVIRTFKALSTRPKRSVRAVLFMNEENGARGGRAYADSAVAKKEKHIFAMESDAGGFSPRGVGLDMDMINKTRVRQEYGPLLAAMNVYDFSLEEGGVDIDPLKKLGVPLAGLVPDQQRYFDYHHAERDVFEAVNHRELKLGAATMAAMIWLVSEYGW
jgi:hypothetical protein